MTTTSASEILVLIDDRKTPPPQVAGDAHHECKFCFCTVVDDWKIHYQFNSCRGSRPSWAQYYIVRAGCSNQLQVGQGQVLIRVVSLCKCLVDAANVTDFDGQ